MEGWYQRIGNNLVQLVNAVTIAKATGTPVIRFPSAASGVESGGINVVLDLPAEIQVDVDEGESWWSRTFNCRCEAIPRDWHAPCAAKEKANESEASNEASR